VEGSIELAVTASVEAVTGSFSAGGFDWCDTGEVRERGFATAAAWMGPGDVDVGGADGTDAELGDELGAVGGGEFVEVPVVGCDLDALSRLGKRIQTPARSTNNA
jgi:hypothetical protein